MDVQVKRRVIAKVDPGKPRQPPRPVSPLKQVSFSASSSTTSTPVVRARAQVSSSAKSNLGRRPAGPSSVVSSNRSTVGGGSTTPRSHSPSKQLDAVRSTVNGRLSPGPAAVSRLRARTNTTSAGSSLPASPLPSANSSPVLSSTPIRVRNASISSISDISIASPQSHLLSPTSSSLSAVSSAHDSDASTTKPMRIKAKVTGMAKSKPSTPSTPTFSTISHVHQQQLPSPAPSSSSSPKVQVTRRIGRTSSVSSLSTHDPIYPINVAHPSANAHRFNSQRSPATYLRQPIPFSSPPSSQIVVDPASIPLPPLSPPSSTVSFSSHSSTSRSSLSSTSQSSAFILNVNGSPDYSGWMDLPPQARARASSVASCETASGKWQQNGSPPVNDERTEAKSIRKIADLEITNSSLLAINTALEASKHQQQKEIRELRKKLRETRLVLPPRIYREMRDSHGPDNFYKDEQDDDEEEEDDDNEAEIDLETTFGEADKGFLRVKALLDTLLESGRHALETTPEDFDTSPKGAKVTRVLHEVEARTWLDKGVKSRPEDISVNDTDLEDESFRTGMDDDSDDSQSSDADDDAFDVDGNNSSRSEDEVEELIGDCTTADSPV